MYEKTLWKNRNVEKPLRYTLTDLGGGLVELTPAPGTVVEVGTPIIAENLNKMEDGIEAAMLRSGDTMTGDLNMADKKIIRPEIKNYAETVVTATGVTGTETLDLSQGNVFDMTLSEATTFVFSNPSASGKACSFTLIIRQPSTLMAVTFPASVKWSNDIAPIFTASKTAIISFLTVNGGSRWYGFDAGTMFTA